MNAGSGDVNPNDPAQSTLQSDAPPGTSSLPRLPSSRVQSPTSSTDPARRSSEVFGAQADALFKFLRETFAQMPRPVQVVAYLSFLALFVLLMLYPLFGITYFQAHVEAMVPAGFEGR